MTYAEYVSYGGTLSESEFGLILPKAENNLKRITFGRALAGTYTAAEKRCLTEMIDKIKEDSDRPMGVASVSNDGYSITFDGSATSQMYTIARNHLPDSYLLMWVDNDDDI